MSFLPVPVHHESDKLKTFPSPVLRTWQLSEGSASSFKHQNKVRNGLQPLIHEYFSFKKQLNQINATTHDQLVFIVHLFSTPEFY